MSSRPAWVNTIPDSRMVYPETFVDQAKYLFWRLYTPVHPLMRDILLGLGIVKHQGRQDYLLGKIAPGQTVKDFVDYLVNNHGYGNHFIAWRDQGEVVGLRYVKNFEHQYHIRIFEDGEVRAHFEYTPECYPFLHLKAIDQKDCREELMQIIGEKIIPA
jgi:hypothetical protein